MAEEINLLKSNFGASKLVSGDNRSLPWLYVLIGVVIFEILAYGAMFFYERNIKAEQQKVDQEFAGAGFEIAEIEQDRLAAVSYQRRLSNLKTLLDRHIFWTAVLDELSKYTYKPARYTSLQADAKEYKLMLSGFVPSYTDLGKLMLGLKQSPAIKDVELVGSSQNDSEEAGYTFDLDVTFDSKLLVK